MDIQPNNSYRTMLFPVNNAMGKLPIKVETSARFRRIMDGKEQLFTTRIDRQQPKDDRYSTVSMKKFNEKRETGNCMIFWRDPNKHEVNMDIQQKKKAQEKHMLANSLKAINFIQSRWQQTPEPEEIRPVAISHNFGFGGVNFAIDDDEENKTSLGRETRIVIVPSPIEDVGEDIRKDSADQRKPDFLERDLSCLKSHEIRQFLHPELPDNHLKEKKRKNPLVSTIKREIDHLGKMNSSKSLNATPTNNYKKFEEKERSGCSSPVNNSMAGEMLYKKMLQKLKENKDLSASQMKLAIANVRDTGTLSFTKSYS